MKMIISRMNMILAHMFLLLLLGGKMSWIMIITYLL